MWTITYRLTDNLSPVGTEVYKLEISHEYIVLSKGIFVGNFLKKFQSSFIYVFKLGTRSSNKISIKLLNLCAGLFGPADIGLPFKSSGQWTWIYSESSVFKTFFVISDLCNFGKQ